MASLYSNHHPQRHVFAASPKTPCHPSNGYEVREEEASPVDDGDTTTATILSRKFDALAGGGSMSNDKLQHEKMPQDPDSGFSAFVADEKKKMSLSVESDVVVVNTKKRRGISVDSADKAPRRRSLRIQRRTSLCVEGGEMSSHDNNIMDDTNTAEMNDSQSEHVVEECQMRVTHDGSSALAQTLEDVVMDLVGLASSSAGQGQHELPSTITNSDDDEDGEGNTMHNRTKAKVKSVLEPLDPIEKENSLNNDKVVKSSNRKKRRDTFDLSRRRGLTRSGMAQSSGGDGMEMEQEDIDHTASTGMDLQIDTDEVDLKPPAIISSTADQADDWTDMITPKNGSNEVQLPNNFANEISNDEPTEIMGSPAVKENLQNLLTSIAIEETMRSIFSEFSVYNYVS